MVKVDDSLYREVVGRPPEGRRVWDFRVPFFGHGQMIDGKRPEWSDWRDRFGKENLSFSTHECDWKKARKIAVKYAARRGLSLVEVKVSRDFQGGE